MGYRSSAAAGTVPTTPATPPGPGPRSAAATAGPPLTRKATPDGHRGDPPTVRRPLRAARPPGRALGLVAARRPQPAVRQRRHGAVQALLPGPGVAALRPGRDRAEVRAHH